MGWFRRLKVTPASTLAAAVMLCALMHTSPGAADAQMSAPFGISPAGVNVRGDALLGVDAHGQAVVSWLFRDAGKDRIAVTSGPLAGPFPAPELLSAITGDAELSQLAVNAAGDAVLVWILNPSNAMQASVRPAGGTWSAVQDLSAANCRATDSQPPRVALDGDGTALALWTCSGSGGVPVVQAAVRPAGGSFEAAVPLSSAPDSALPPDVAFSPAGDATITWVANPAKATGSVVQSVTRPHDGGFTAPVNVTTDRNGISITDGTSVAVDPSGGALVLWREAATADIGASWGPLKEAYRPVGGAWGAPVLVSSADPAIYQTVFDGAGNALTVWGGTDSAAGDTYDVEYAFRPAAGTLGPPRPLAPSGFDQDAWDPTVAAASGGDMFVAWTLSSGPSSAGTSQFRIQGALRPAGASVFDVPVDISPFGYSYSRPVAAFDQQGNVLVVWTGRATKDDPNLVQGSYGRPVPAATPEPTPTATPEPTPVPNVATPTPPRAPRDTIAPTLTVTGKTRQKPASSLALQIGCSEACAWSAGVVVSVPKVGKAKAKTFRFTTVGRQLAARRSTKIKVSLPASVRSAIGKAARAHKTIKVTLTVRASDAAGNTSTRTLTVRVR